MYFLHGDKLQHVMKREVCSSVVKSHTNMMQIGKKCAKMFCRDKFIKTLHMFLLLYLKNLTILN